MGMGILTKLMGYSLRKRIRADVVSIAGNKIQTAED
jgi:hypothetical protein